jgi:hypothetical protein
VTVIRQRRRQVPSPSNPDRTVPADWSDEPGELPLEGAYIGDASSSAPPDPTRSQSVTTKSLYLTDATADVLRGDRVVSAAGNKYDVRVKPDAVRNPFTGWCPVLEVPLVNVEG